MRDGWQTRPVAEVCTTVTDGSHFSPPTTATGYPYITVRDIKNGQIDLESCAFVSEVSYDELRRNGCSPAVGDVLFSKDGTVGKVALVTSPRAFVVLSSLAILRPNASLIDPAYLSYVLMSPAFLEAAIGQKTGVAIRRIILKNLKQIPVSYPPLPEQRRIVAILDEAFEAIATAKANTEKNLQNAREVFDERVQAVFTRRGAEFTDAALADVCDIVSKLIDPRDDQFLDLPHVGAGNIESKSGALTDVLTTREEQLISGKFLFDESTVLYSKIRPYLMKVVRPDFCGLCSADIYPLAPKQGLIDRDYLYHLLLSPLFTEYAIKGSARAGMPKVNREHLFAFRFALPPVDQQMRAAANLDALAEEIRRLESIFSNKLTALDELKKSLLHQAFTGALTSKCTDQQVAEVA